MNTLEVTWDGALVGRLVETGKQAVSFQYAQEYLSSARPRPISLSLPLQADAFDGDVAKAWFANLLPEGEIRGHVARRLGVSERNEFALLAGVGGDCAGALRILPEHAADAEAGKLIPLPWDELEATIAATPRPSLLALVMQDRELRLSLAGAQDKLPVHFADGRLSLPSGIRASTHLLKIASGGFPDLVQNELYCLTLARSAGLDVPDAQMAATATPILIVERYDRRTGADGSVQRLHQEDFCQALGLPPDMKYENEGGPSLAAMFEVLARGSRSPLPDKRELLKWVLFNYVIGNADAHAKNVSLLHGDRDDDRGPRLAPFYDLVCTEVYGGLARRQAQKIGGEYRTGSLGGRHWDRFAAAIDVNPKYLRTVAEELCERVEAAAAPPARTLGDNGAGGAMLERIADVVGKRIGKLRADLAS
ncbi:MAG: type II toxin-antitoxin system HipA family toxin [bacterium]|nr:type II toxin-antitoxin system HipA family toxin [bacterium]